MSRVSTTTNSRLDAKVVDLILNSNVFATRMLAAAKPWRSGSQIEKSVKVSKSGNGSSFSGMDTFSTSTVDNRIKLTFSPKFYAMTTTVPLTDVWTNQGDPNRITDLMDIELTSAAEDAADDIGTMFYADGTGNSSKDFLGLEAIVDDGSNAATYGGQTRASYDSLDATVTASGGTLTLAKMATLYSAISSGSVKPTLGLTTETVWNLYEQLLQPQERIMKNVGMRKGMPFESTTGFTGLAYKGIPILADEKATSGVLYFVNEDHLEFRGLPTKEGTKAVNYRVQDIEGNDYTSLEGLGFSATDWIQPNNQAALTKHIYLGGELWSSAPKRHGKLTGVTSV